MREWIAQILYMSSHTVCCGLGVHKDTGSNSGSGLISFKSLSPESEHWGYRNGIIGSRFLHIAANKHTMGVGFILLPTRRDLLVVAAFGCVCAQ